MNSIINSVVLHWVGRRVLELGGLGTFFYGLYTQLGPSQQAVITQAVSGDWQNIPLGAAVGLAVALWGYAWSFRSTVKPHVTVDGTRVSTQALPAPEKAVVEDVARTAAVTRPKASAGIGDLLKRMFGKAA